MNRREFIPLVAAGLLSGTAGFVGGRQTVPERQSRTIVHLGKLPSYSADLLGPILESLRANGVSVADKIVLLKPRLESFTSTDCDNTHPAVVAAAIEAFKQLGAAEI